MASKMEDSEQRNKPKDINNIINKLDDTWWFTAINDADKWKQRYDCLKKLSDLIFDPEQNKKQLITFY